MIPRFSVIIPHYNDWDRLQRCLEALERQDYPTDAYHIIIVDDASPTSIPNALRGRLSGVLLLQNKENRGPAFSRNRGLDHAEGEYVALVDSDVVVEPGWLTAMEQEFVKGEVVICGPLLHGRSLLSRLTAITAFGEFQALEDGYRHHCLTANAALRREVLERFRFDDSIRFSGEDAVLSRQLLRAHYRIRYLAQAHAFHDPVLSLRRFFFRAYRYGEGFRASRASDPDLPGAVLHRYLGALSCIPLFVLRTGRDIQRMILYRRQVFLDARNVLPTLAGIIAVRLVYSAGVVGGYLSRS